MDKYSLDPDSLYAKKSKHGTTRPSRTSGNEDIEMGDVSATESEEFLLGDGVEEDEETLLAEERDDYGYKDPEGVVEVSDEEEEGEGEVDDILRDDADVDDEAKLGPEGPDDDAMHEDPTASLGYAEY